MAIFSTYASAPEMEDRREERINKREERRD
jgi:hypothetical protein